MNNTFIDIEEEQIDYSVDSISEASTLDLARKYPQLMALYNSTGEAKYLDLAEKIEEELFKNGYQID